MFGTSTTHTWTSLIGMVVLRINEQFTQADDVVLGFLWFWMDFRIVQQYLTVFKRSDVTLISWMYNQSIMPWEYSICRIHIYIYTYIYIHIHVLGNVDCLGEAMLTFGTSTYWSKNWDRYPLVNKHMSHCEDSPE